MNAQVVERCRKMELDELASFIRDSLKRMYEPDPGGDRPHTYEEFLEVWRLLSAKYELMPTDPPPPLNPLEKAYAKRKRTEKLFNEALGNPQKYNLKARGKMLGTLEHLDREIEKMEESGEYDTASAPATETRKQAAARTKSEVFETIESAFKQKPTGRRLQWRPARPGTLSVSFIRGYCEQRRHQDPEFKFDMERIEKAYALGPDGPPWVGPDGLDGYVIFPYATGASLMECPEIGNAAYVIHKDWETWSQMDKQELMSEAERGSAVTRIPHQGEDWPVEIRRALGFE